MLAKPWITKGLGKSVKVKNKLLLSILLCNKILSLTGVSKKLCDY